MKGQASECFCGVSSEEFGVEILGVLPGYPNPRQSAIIRNSQARTSIGPGCSRECSGSPVYIDGKLVGAIAFISLLQRSRSPNHTDHNNVSTSSNAPAREGNGTTERHVPQSFTQLASTELKVFIAKQTGYQRPMIASVSGGSLPSRFCVNR